MSNVVRLAMATPEAAPFARTGGLGDVLGALPSALERRGVRVTLIMPAYRETLRAGLPFHDTGWRFGVPVSSRTAEGGLLEAPAAPGAPRVRLVRADRYFDRDGLYGSQGVDYPDNAERFVFFSRAVLEVLRRDPPDVLHCHDWQSALAIAFLRAQPEAYPELAALKTVMTVHNLGYQGVFPLEDWHLLNLDWSYFTFRRLEFHGKVNFLKGGLVFGDAITTVSPSYAEEIKTPAQGHGLDGVFRERAADLVGILNGADYEVWNPETDPHIALPFSPAFLLGKRACKRDLQKVFGLPVDPAAPLLGMVCRMVDQKGVDLVLDALEGLVRRGARFALLGNGDPQFEEAFRLAAARHPAGVSVRIAFDDALAHKVIAGADMFLMPSRYEPSGLNQIYALKYGTIPIVRATGGLKATVQPFDPTTGEGTGFLFEPYDATALLEAVDRALAVFRRKEAWTRLMNNAMAADFSWARSAPAYLEVYRRVLGGKRVTGG